MNLVTNTEESQRIIFHFGYLYYPLLEKVSPQKVNLTQTDKFPEVQKHSRSAGKLAIANAVITRTLRCPLGRAAIFLPWLLRQK